MPFILGGVCSPSEANFFFENLFDNSKRINLTIGIKAVIVMMGTIIVDSGDCLDFDATYNKLINVIKNRFR